MKRVFWLLICIIPVLLLVGCTKKTTNDIKPIKIEQFIIQKTEEDKILNYTFKNEKYVKITDSNVKDKYLLYYNEKYNTAEYNDGGNILIEKNNKSIKMPDNTEMARINNECSKVFYKLKNGESYSYNIIDIDEGKSVSIDVEISGNCVAWKDSSTLVFYGILNNKAALYYYDINTKSIKIAAKVSDGFVNYIGAIEDKIYYLVKNFDGSSRMMMLEKGKSDSLNIVVPYKTVYDIKKIDNTDVILAGNDERADLYYISDGKIEKANYDFPNHIKVDSFLYRNGKNIYFIGLNEDNNEGIYLFSVDANEIQLKDMIEGNNHIALNN